MAQTVTLELTKDEATLIGMGLHLVQTNETVLTSLGEFQITDKAKSMARNMSRRIEPLFDVFDDTEDEALAATLVDAEQLELELDL